MKSITSTALRTLVVGATLNALALSFTTLARAAESSTPPQAVVKFADLNPSTSQGAVALYGRIHGAAEDVCTRLSPSEEAYRSHKYVCLQKVIADAVNKVNEPALSAVYASKYRVPAPVVLATAGDR